MRVMNGLMKRLCASKKAVVILNVLDDIGTHV